MSEFEIIGRIGYACQAVKSANEDRIISYNFYEDVVNPKTRSLEKKLKFSLQAVKIGVDGKIEYDMGTSAMSVMPHLQPEESRRFIVVPAGTHYSGITYEKYKGASWEVVRKLNEYVKKVFAILISNATTLEDAPSDLTSEKTLDFGISEAWTYAYAFANVSVDAQTRIVIPPACVVSNANEFTTKILDEVARQGMGEVMVVPVSVKGTISDHIGTVIVVSRPDNKVSLIVCDTEGKRTFRNGTGDLVEKIPAVGTTFAGGTLTIESVINLYEEPGQYMSGCGLLTAAIMVIACSNIVPNDLVSIIKAYDIIAAGINRLELAQKEFRAVVDKTDTIPKGSPKRQEAEGEKEYAKFRFDGTCKAILEDRGIQNVLIKTGAIKKGENPTQCSLLYNSFSIIRNSIIKAVFGGGKTLPSTIVGEGKSVVDVQMALAKALGIEDIIGIAPQARQTGQKYILKSLAETIKELNYDKVQISDKQRTH
jgi:hypothetical protein